LEKIKSANEGRYVKPRKFKENFTPQKISQIYEYKTEIKEEVLNPLKEKFGLGLKTTAKKAKIFGHRESMNSFKFKTSNKNGGFDGMETQS
jgi:hypothetical protein